LPYNFIQIILQFHHALDIAIDLFPQRGILDGLEVIPPDVDQLFEQGLISPQFCFQRELWDRRSIVAQGIILAFQVD